MTQEDFNKAVEILTEDRKQVAEGKREDYTKGDKDVLKNFKNQFEALGVDPKVSLAVHMEKQFSAVLNYIKTDGDSESEPIIKRIGDCINYLELLWGLIQEETINLKYRSDGASKCCGNPKKCDISSCSNNDKEYISRDEATEEYGLCSCDNIQRCKENNQCKKEVPEFCDTPNACYYEGCMCERTNKFFDEEKLNKRKEDLWRYELCYVEDNIAYFTNDFENQWGDDWNDAPYEHNAGYPYNDNDNIIAIEFDGNFVTPDDGYRNSPYSVEDINNGEYWWLFNKDKKSQLYAGATIQEFKNFIERNDGKILNGLDVNKKDTIGIKHGSEDLYGKLADKNNLIEVGSNVWKKEGDDSDLRWKLTKAGFQPLHETGRSFGI